MVAKFYEDAELDTAWQDIAQKDVGEPEEEEEAAEKLEKLRSLITSKFEQPVDEELLSEANLKRFLRASKWDPMEALKIFLGTATLLKDFPNFLLPQEKSEKKSFDASHKECLVWAAPGREEHGSRVVFLNLTQWESSKFSYAYEYSLFQLISTEPRTQVGGVVVVLDLAGFGWKHLKAFGIQELRCIGSFLSGGFPVWFRAIHYVNHPWIFNKLFSILKPFLSDKIVNTITWHGGNTDSLVAAVNPDLLPKKLGGNIEDAELKAAGLNCLLDLQDRENEVQEAMGKMVALSKMKQKS